LSIVVQKEDEVLKSWLLALLRDPVDGCPLRLESESLIGAADRPYPIVRSVARFVPSEKYAGTFGYQWNLFAKTQLDSANGTTRSRDTFVDKTGFSLEELRGKTVLDVGCGMGRFAEVVAQAGARVVGVDLSQAVDAAAANLAGFDNAAVVQADLFSLPFAPESFDVIYSVGVLHHTPNTRRAFQALLPYLRDGGKIAIWVYPRTLRWKYPMSLLYRLVTPRISRDRLLRWCETAVRSRLIQQPGPIGSVLRRLFQISARGDIDWLVLDAFDWYSPRFQWTHTEAQVEAWFREAGLKDLWRGRAAVSIGGAKP